MASSHHLLVTEPVCLFSFLFVTSFSFAMIELLIDAFNIHEASVNEWYLSSCILTQFLKSQANILGILTIHYHLV